MAKIGIFGSGTWGVALGIHLNRIGHEVEIWSPFADEAVMLNETHKLKNLPNAVIPESIIFTADTEKACTDKDIIVLAVASIYTRSTAHKMAPFVKEGQIIINVGKGIEEDTLKTQTDITSEEIPQAVVTVLSGPSHAEEVSVALPTAVVVGAADRAVAEYIQNIFMSPDFRVYISPDMTGMEIGGSLKNVIALAAGMMSGLGYGDNAAAALITRGITELARLGEAMGCDQRTFYGLTGIGDLIVTCQSEHSRNRRAGVLMGQGKTMKEAMDEVQMVVEGVYSTKAGKQLADKYHVNMPIVEAVNEILFHDKPAREAAYELMTRDKISEHPEYNW